MRWRQRTLPWLAAMACVASAVCPAARATTIEKMEFPELVEKAGMIFRGQVTESQAHRKRMPGGDDPIFTAVTFRILETYKGEPGAEITLDFLGGTVGEETFLISGMPRFAVGDEVVIFTDPILDSVCPALAWHYGLFKVEQAEGGGDEVTGITVVPDPSAANFRASAARVPEIVGAHAPSAATTKRLSLDAFKASLQAQLEADAR